MGAMFRSEEMRLCQLFIQPEAAYQSVSDLGEMGSVQFRDLNEGVNAFQRKFVSEVRRCDELERKLRYIEAEMLKDGGTIPELKENEVPKAPNPREIIVLESNLEKTEREILELSENAVGLKSTFLELTELRHVLEKAQVFFQEQESADGSDSLTKALIADDPSQAIRGRLGFVAGVIPRERVAGFERMLWRISRGNVFLRQADLEEAFEDPATGNEIRKTVFVAFFQGEQLKNRVKKICSGFHASIYNCPNLPAERADMLQGLCTRLEDLNMVLNQTKDHRHRVLMSLANDLNTWIVMVRKMKAIYHVLNMFNMDVTKKCMIAECWVPVGDMANVRKALADGGVACGSSIPSFMNVIPTSENPPTFNRVNKFTRGFQNLIDAYGIASYREVNPALYTIIIFPFLFGVMFGDLGHGIILTLFGAFMVIKEKSLGKMKSGSEVWDIFFGGRYIILLMGLFSMYTGFIYNDFFSKSMNIFGSSWKVHYSLGEVQNNTDLTLDPAEGGYTHDPYPIGLDPVWQVAANKIIFLNSYKMKLSIIIGVIHMIFGVCMSVVNHLHFRTTENIVLEFVPQLLFLVLLFAWMVVMMFMKWVMYTPQNDVLATGPRCAPSVLILFINMMLLKHTPPFDGCNEYMFEGQDLLQKVFLIIALLCVPVMLLGKPLYVMFTRRTRQVVIVAGDLNQGLEMKPENEMESQFSDSPAVHEEEEEMSEIFIHQAIHTIEYVLSTISHTASYLRLWALSLAHAQLSEVLWTMVLRIGLKVDGYVGAIMIFLLFAAWATFSVGILVMMEGLSAFLHTLRLHWVEFMSKFYVGQGYAFEPFSFKAIFEQEDEEE